MLILLEHERTQKPELLSFVEEFSVCDGCSEEFDHSELISDGSRRYCTKCWDSLCERDARADESTESKQFGDFSTVIVESAKPAAVQELKRLLYKELKRRRGVVRFAYIKRNGVLRHARAGYQHYVPKPGSANRRRAEDVITYYDLDKRNFRSFREDQLVDSWPQWSRN